MLYTRQSEFTGRMNTMDLPVTPEQIEQWKRSGELIQRALPTLNTEQREFLLTGATPQEWDEVFGPEE